MLLGAGGTLAWVALGSWWAVPAFAVYGALYGGAADSRWHEAGHGTAFRTRWPNDVVYYVASFMMLRGPTRWRWSHARHHTDTIIVGRDPEILFPRSASRWTVVATFLGLRTVPRALWELLRHAAGRLDPDTRSFVPSADWPKVIREARWFVAILAGAICWAALTSSIVPLLFVGLPSLYGVWLAVFFAATQHAGLREDVLDHRLNTWTVRMNPVFRFLYSNMNYHVEHHLFPTVPYHALPALHDEIKAQLPPAPSVLAAYRTILHTLGRQRDDPSYELPDRPAPVDARVAGPSRELAPLVRADGRVDLGAAAAMSVGDVRRADVDGRTFAVFRLGADDYAVTDGRCTHGRAHLAEGMLVDCATIECPKHNGRFDARTGKPLRRPAVDPLATYPTAIVDGRLVADLRNGAAAG